VGQLADEEIQVGSGQLPIRIVVMRDDGGCAERCRVCCRAFLFPGVHTDQRHVGGKLPPDGTDVDGITLALSFGDEVQHPHAIDDDAKRGQWQVQDLIRQFMEGE
jgi:hypothetical protein